MLARFQFEPPVRNLVERAVRVLVLALFGIMALQNLGVDLLPLIAGVGVAGAGVALAMQGVLGNIVAGLTIIFTRPFRVGDWVSIAKEEGEVLDISLSATILGHADLSRVVIPNRKIVGEILHNHGKLRQLDVEIGVAYGTDMKAAARAIEEALRALPRLKQEPAPLIRIARFGESAVTLRVSPWVSVTDYVPAGAELHQAILDAVRSRGIVVPVPQREVRMLAAA
jgi:small conductance mechanosensitive channel